MFYNIRPMRLERANDEDVLHFTSAPLLPEQMHN